MWYKRNDRAWREPGNDLIFPIESFSCIASKHQRPGTTSNLLKSAFQFFMVCLCKRIQVLMHTCSNTSVMSDYLWPMGCSQPGAFVHGILHSRIWDWIALPTSRGSSQPRNQTHISCISGRFFYPLRPWEAPKFSFLHCRMCCCCWVTKSCPTLRFHGV